MTALADIDPVAGAQRKGTQSLQWSLSEFGWEQRELLSISWY